MDRDAQLKNFEDFISNPIDGYHSLIITDTESGGYQRVRNLITFIMNNDIKFYEIIITRSFMDIGFIYFLLLSSNRKIQKLIIPDVSIYANGQLKQIFCNQFINLNILTHLEIHIPELNNHIATTFIRVCQRGVVYHIGLQPSKIIDTANLLLFYHLGQIDNVKSIRIYITMFNSLSKHGVVRMFQYLQQSNHTFDYIGLSLGFYTQHNLESKVYISNNGLIPFLSSANVKSLELYNDTRNTYDSYLPSDFFKNMFERCISNNTFLSKLIVNNKHSPIKNALEIMELLFQNNYTLVKLSFEWKERKKSIRERKTNEIIHRFLTRNRDLTKKFKTLFQMMIDSVDLDESNKKQRIQ